MTSGVTAAWVAVYTAGSRQEGTAAMQTKWTATKEVVAAEYNPADNGECSDLGCCDACKTLQKRQSPGGVYTTC